MKTLNELLEKRGKAQQEMADLKKKLENNQSETSSSDKSKIEDELKKHDYSIIILNPYIDEMQNMGDKDIAKKVDIDLKECEVKIEYNKSLNKSFHQVVPSIYIYDGWRYEYKAELLRWILS